MHCPLALHLKLTLLVGCTGWRNWGFCKEAKHMHKDKARKRNAKESEWQGHVGACCCAQWVSIYGLLWPLPLLSDHPTVSNTIVLTTLLWGREVSLFLCVGGNEAQIPKGSWAPGYLGRTGPERLNPRSHRNVAGQNCLFMENWPFNAAKCFARKVCLLWLFLF